MKANELKDKIVEKETQRLLSQGGLYRKNNNWASDIGECAREMFYSITAWDKKPMPDPHLLARFEEGREQEKKVIMKLMDNGFEIVEGQKPFAIKDRTGRVILTGRIDGKIKWDSTYIPFEVKSMNPNIYDQINTMEDFQKYEHTRKYPLQMISYLFGENLEEGVFILTDCLGHYKVVPLQLDLGLMESIMQRCELVMDAVDTNNPPDFIKNAAKCRKCWALGKLCHPPLDFGPGIEIIADEEMNMKLSRWYELRDAKSEYDKLDKDVKEYFKGRPHTICGDYEIVGKERIMNFKPQPEARQVKSWVTEIQKITEIA